MAPADVRYDFLRRTAGESKGLSRISRKSDRRGSRLHLNWAGTEPDDRETGISFPESHVMMPRAVTCVFLLAAAANLRAADPPIPNSPTNDAREIVRRAAEHNQQNSNNGRNYTYLQRQDTRELDHSGQVKSRKVETWQITYLDGRRGK